MSKKDPGRCAVCDDAAIGLNFGVLTCMPCKAFFRRNALRFNTSGLVCKSDGNCQVTYKYRRACNACRLTKCFHMGMKQSLILSNEQREIRNKLVQENRLKRGKLPQQECAQWMQSPGLIHMTSNSIKCLSSQDQLVLDNIFNAYENTCIAVRDNQFSSFPLVIHDCLHEFFNELSKIFPIFIEYFKRIPEFVNILMEDKIRLIKTHFGIMIHINEQLMYPITSNNLLSSWINIFGVDLTFRLLKRNQIIQQYIADPLILKLVLIILVLSSSNSRDVHMFDLDMVCDHPISIFLAQSIYVELLWNYILSRSANQCDAVKFYNKLIMCLLYMTELDRDIDCHISACQSEVRQMKPILQNMWLNPDDEIADDLSTR